MPVVPSKPKAIYNVPAMTTLVSLECYEPMGRDRLVRQPWSDVSVTFIDEPRGETLRFEPTLLSYACLERDLLYARERQQKRPTEKDSALIDKLEKILEELNGGAEFYTESDSPEDQNPEIYTRNHYIDQLEAERMLVHFLGARGFTDLGFQWVWPEYIATVG